MGNLLSRNAAERFMFEPVFYGPLDNSRISVHSVEKIYNVLKDVMEKAAEGEAFSKLDLKQVCTKHGVGVFSKNCVEPIYSKGFVPTVYNAEILRRNLNGWIKSKLNKAEEKHEEVQGVIDFGEPAHVDEMIKDVCVKIRMLRQRGYIFECENGGLTIKKLFTTKIL